MIRPSMIRPYRDDDFEMIKQWHLDHETDPPLPGMMVKDGTFVVEEEGVALMCVTALKTQSCEISYLEGFCSKPGMGVETRRALGALLAEHCYQYLSEAGFKRVVCLSPHPSLTRRYEELGFRSSMNGLESLMKEL